LCLYNYHLINISKKNQVVPERSGSSVSRMCLPVSWGFQYLWHGTLPWVNIFSSRHELMALGRIIPQSNFYGRDDSSGKHYTHFNLILSEIPKHLSVSKNICCLYKKIKSENVKPVITSPCVWYSWKHPIKKINMKYIHGWCPGWETTKVRTFFASSLSCSLLKDQPNNHVPNMPDFKTL